MKNLGKREVNYICLAEKTKRRVLFQKTQKAVLLHPCQIVVPAAVKEEKNLYAQIKLHQERGNSCHQKKTNSLVFFIFSNLMESQLQFQSSFQCESVKKRFVSTAKMRDCLCCLNILCLQQVDVQLMTCEL